MARLLQLSPGVAPYDATLLLMLGLAHSLKGAGDFRSFDISARHIPAGFKIQDRLIHGRAPISVEDLELRKYSSEDILVYHHGIAADAEALIRQFPGPRFLVYHGITPAQFYLPYSLTVAGRLERGRRELERLAPLFERAYCFSAVTEADLRGAGYLNIRKIDPPLFPTKLSHASGASKANDPSRAANPWKAADPWKAKYASKANGPSNPANPDAPHQNGASGSSDSSVRADPVLLSLGRIVPNKNHEPLIRALKQLKTIHPGASLILAGELRPGLEGYHRHLRDVVRALNLQDSVEFTGLLREKDLESIWQRSTHYVCSSLHEGYCLPLVESMSRGRPVIYLDDSRSAARETMDGAGIGFRPMDTGVLCELISEIHTNQALRGSILEGQFRRLMDLQPEDLARDILSQLTPVGGVDD